jgi:hypothetical protein
VTDIDAPLVVGEQWIIDPAHVTAALDAHRGVADVAEQGLASLRSLSVAEANKVSWWAYVGPPWCTSLRRRSHACPVCPALVRCYVQVPLMAALPTAQAAMDAHRGVAAVAEQGLGFLCNLSVAEANRVSWWACLGQHWCTPPCVIRMHARPVCPPLVRCCVQMPLMAALPTALVAMDAHRGVAAVAERGLAFLRSLAVAEANRVSWWT